MEELTYVYDSWTGIHATVSSEEKADRLVRDRRDFVDRWLVEEAEAGRRHVHPDLEQEIGWNRTTRNQGEPYGPDFSKRVPQKRFVSYAPCDPHLSGV